MEQYEKEMMDKLRQQAESIEIPKKLRPGMMEKTLEEQRKKKRRKNYRYILAAAACMALLCISYVQMKTVGFQRQTDNLIVEEIRGSSKIRMAESYEEVYKFVKVIKEGKNSAKGGGFEAKDAVSSQKSTSSGSKTNDSSKKSLDYSETNTREKGVDEADVAKTDGRYIYVIKDEGDQIGIVDTQEKELSKVAEITIEGCRYISEIYVKDQLLIVLYTEDIPDYDVNEEGIYKTLEDSKALYNGNTKVVVYDLSDIKNPKDIGGVTQNGNYYTSRLNGEYLYTFSDYYVYSGSKEEEFENYVPCVNGKALSYEKICLPDVSKAERYMVITAVNIYNPNEISDSIGILSDSGLCYVSSENIYMCDYLYNGNDDISVIRKIAYHDGKMEGRVKAEIKGGLNDSFSIDEYDGYLRVVTSRATTDSNSIYVLDEELEMVGKIEDLAKNERVYSVRFMGEIGYFVTFRETDPLFSVDLSNPSEPRIIGELKIPGFSEYLHPYGEGKLLGIGMEIDEKGTVADEVKLSMFDVSDPSDVKETDKCILEGAYWSTAFDEYKSVTIDTEKNLIGFLAAGEREKYYVYGYDKEKGFYCKFDKVLNSYSPVRGMYIGEVFYLINGNQIASYSLDSFENIDSIVLDPMFS